MERIEQSIDINAPLKHVYAQCTRFSDYPRFMEGMEAVRMADERHLHWRAVRDGGVREWSSVITERDPDRYIAWHDVDGPHRTFTISLAALEEMKTRIVVAVSLPGETGKEKDGAAGERLSLRLSGDLERLKRLLENEGHDWNEWPSTHDPQAASIQSIPVFDTFSDHPPHEDAAQPASQSSSHQQQTHSHSARNTERPASARMHAGIGETGNAIMQGLRQGLDQPLSMVRKMSGEMDQLFERLLGRPMNNPLGKAGAGRWMPTLDVVQRDKELVVSVDLPGVDKQDVHIELLNDRITIEGERRAPGEQKSLPGYRPECTYGRFYKQLSLPAGVQAEQIRATLHNGVLEIRMPLPPGVGSQGHRVDIEGRP